MLSCIAGALQTYNRHKHTPRVRTIFVDQNRVGVELRTFGETRCSDYLKHDVMRAYIMFII